MPTRNTRKIYAAEQIYHIYSRGVAKAPVFLDRQDHQYFIDLFARYLSNTPAQSKARVQYAWYGDRLELLAFCLMKNHVHLLVYQSDEQAMTDFMHSLMTSYSMYFNKKYIRVGPVFQSRYLASNIDKDNYLQHISRYIHLNPKDWQNYPYSSLPYYIHNQSEAWLKPERISEIFESSSIYLNFLKDYESHKQMLDELKLELAHE
jgi:putative transposase